MERIQSTHTGVNDGGDAGAESFLRSGLPQPFRADRFVRLRTGIHDDPAISVYVNEQRDFAALFPQPRLNYERYEPRFRALGLSDYRKRNLVVERRFNKVREWFKSALDVLEIGAGDGAFLRYAREQNPALRVASVEVDANSQAARAEVEGLEQHADFGDLVAHGRRFQVVCFFHVLEHIVDPSQFLDRCRAVLAPGGCVIVEVPSLDDPLLVLYAIPEYETFHFQRQHPYVYSARSLTRLLEAHGLRVGLAIPHQRYGLENHLTWLARRRPGGDERLRTLFAAEDGSYRERLEAEGLTDAVIVVAHAAY